jgi:hypothetical protein
MTSATMNYSTQSLPDTKSTRITFTMAVSPSTNEVSPDKIIAWYMAYFMDFDLGTNPTITYNTRTRLYEVSFTPALEFPTDKKDRLFELELFADPDEDGNYPIKAGKKRLLVIGEILTLNGETV